MPKGDKNEKKTTDHTTLQCSVSVCLLSQWFFVESLSDKHFYVVVLEYPNVRAMAMVLVCTYRALVCMVAIVSV